MSSFQFRHLVIVITILGTLQMAVPEEAGPEPFVIEFFQTKAAFSGSIDSKASADALAAAIVSARPDLNIVNTGMEFDPGVSMPELKLLKSLVVEIALSTTEGVFEISDDSLLIGGLTDSVVTASVLRLRANPILGERRFREQLCLVPTEDLPEIPILLSTGESRKSFSFDLELKLKEEVTFEPPGIILTKILDLIEGTADPSLYPNIAPVPSAPVSMVETPALVEAKSQLEVTTEVIPEPPSPYERFGPVLYARNGIVLQEGQKELITSLPEVFQSDPWTGRPIIVRSLIYQSGSETFSTWISERRLAETVRHLTEAGVGAERLAPETLVTTDRIDKGEVQLLILKPQDYISPSEPTR